jgi:cytochrome P450
MQVSPSRPASEGKELADVEAHADALRPVGAPRTPPGPPGQFDLARLRERPLHVLAEWSAAYGDIFRYRADRWNVVVVNRPEYAKHVLEDNNRNYLKAGTPDLMMLKPMLGEGLMTTEGETWLRQRRFAQPAFRRERIRSFDALMTAVTEEMLRMWSIAAGSDESLDIEAEMTRLTLNIVSRALFSFDISGEDSHFGQAVQAMNECMAHYDPKNQQLMRAFFEGQKVMRSLANKAIGERCAHTEADADDLLAILIHARAMEGGGGPADRRLQDQIMTFLMAGHETTSKALTWTFYLIDQHPEAAGRLRAELREVLGGRAPTYDDLPRLPYLGMVVDESMRLYPPVWLMSRVCQGEDAIDGYRIPPGTLVIVSPYVLHRHPRYWPEPKTFDPERFHPERAPARPPYAYFPFSGGPRLCIGRPFAAAETRLVLATVAQRFALRLVPGHAVEPEALVTLRPRHGMPMTIAPVTAA